MRLVSDGSEVVVQVGEDVLEMRTQEVRGQVLAPCLQGVQSRVSQWEVTQSQLKGHLGREKRTSVR